MQEEERSLRNPLIKLGSALKPLLSELVTASAVAVPAFAEESITLKEHLLYCEEVVEFDDDFNVFRQYFEACTSASY